MQLGNQVRSADGRTRAVDAELGLGRAIEILAEERARVRGVGTGVRGSPST
jgi:hypothetical protein